MSGTGRYTLRKALPADGRAIENLIARSIRHLGLGDYTPEQIELALEGAFGLDTQLLEDGTYYVADTGGTLVGCGGWSFRRTLFGSDSNQQRDANRLDPVVDAARIRAFFVDPVAARQGIGSAILARCEADALAHGFHRAELMATLPGVRLYAARGYRGDTRVRHPLGRGMSIEFVPMSKTLPGGA